MTRDRFDNILKCRRFIDYCASTNEMLNSLRASDPFWAVPGFCDELSTPFGLLWNPGQLLDIDEQTVPWKGRHRCRCYKKPKKPKKWHPKVYCLNDSQIGYLLNFPYAIGAGKVPSNGHILFTDNWFTSFSK